MLVVALGLAAGCGESAGTSPEPDVSSTAEIASSSTTVAASTSTSTSTSPPTTTAPATTFSPPPPPPPLLPPAPTSDLELARAMGVPSAAAASVVFSGCWGRSSSTHWGYYNYLGAGSVVVERDGAVVQPGQICLNPDQPSTISSLIHELGHKWFWENGLWDRVIANYGSYQRGAECFAAIWGATVFGSGGCPDDQQLQMRAEFGW